VLDAPQQGIRATPLIKQVGFIRLHVQWVYGEGRQSANVCLLAESD
jgi:hypothetical protein